MRLRPRWINVSLSGWLLCSRRPKFLWLVTSLFPLSLRVSWESPVMREWEERKERSSNVASGMKSTWFSCNPMKNRSSPSSLFVFWKLSSQLPHCLSLSFFLILPFSLFLIPLLCILEIRNSESKGNKWPQSHCGGTSASILLLLSLVSFADTNRLTGESSVNWVDKNSQLVRRGYVLFLWFAD